MKDKRIIRVSLISRKPVSGNYSIEKLFKTISEYPCAGIEFKICEAPLFSRGLLNRLILILWAYFQRGDIYHVTGDIHFVTLALPTARTILTIHDCEFVRRSKGVKKWLLNLFWLQLPIRNAKWVTTVSEFSRKEIVSLTGCNPDKVVVVHNFLHQMRGYLGNERIKREYDVPVILQIGTKPNKNLKSVIDAIEGENFVLRIVGRVNKETWAYLERCGIRFENFVDIGENQLWDLYNSSDVLTYISTYEGFGLPILEAQRFGLPVITSNTASMPEVAGYGAVMVDPNDIMAIRTALSEILQSDTKRKSLIQLGYDNLKRFSLDRSISGYLDVYNRIIDAK